MFNEGFGKVKEKAIDADAQGPLFDERAFVDTQNDFPLWARSAWEGNYFLEELEADDSRNVEKFNHRSELY